MWCIQGCTELKELLAVSTNVIGNDGNFYYSHKSVTNNYLTSWEWDCSNKPRGEIISVEEFKFRYLDKFIVDCTNNTVKERQEVLKFLIEYRNYGKFYLNADYYPIIACNKKEGDSLYDSITYAQKIHPNHKVYTFEEFKQKNKNSMEKKIISYKLTKPEYRDVVAKIIKCQIDFNYKNYDNLILDSIGNSYSIDLLKKAGVLNLWFEPVYEEIEKTISVGGKFDVVIKNKEIWHKSDNITTFVKSLCDIFKGILKDTKYTYEVKEVVFSRTGCQNVETTLTDWLEVLKEIDWLEVLKEIE